MKCNIIRDLLPLYCDDMASDESREEIDIHLASCEECRKIYEDMKSGRIEIKNNFENLDPLKKVRRKIWTMRITAVLAVIVMIFSGCYFFLCKNPSLAKAKQVDCTTETDLYGKAYLYEKDGKRDYVSIPNNAEFTEDTAKDCVYMDGELLKDKEGNNVPAGGEMIPDGQIIIHIDVDTSLTCIKTKLDSYGSNDDLWIYPCLPFGQDMGCCYECKDDLRLEYSVAYSLVTENQLLTIHCKDKDIKLDIKKIAEEAIS